MTIRRRYHLSLVIVLALFAANLFAYFWSAHMRSMAGAEWSNAAAGEMKIFSIHQELDLLNKEASVTSQLQQEYHNALVNDEISAFERKVRTELTEIDDLAATSPAGLRPAIEDFRRNYLELSDNWLTFYRNAGREDADNAAAVRALVRADELAVVVFGSQLPNLQALEAAQVNHAQVQFQRAEQVAYRMIIATFLLSVLIAFALSVVLSRRLDFGFSTVKRGAQLIGEMDLEYRIAYPHTDEFSGLARAFNEMAAKLALARQQFVETNRRLRESEARYRNLVDRAVYGIFRCSGGRFQEANPALVRMLGYTDVAEVLNLDMVSGVFCDSRNYSELSEKLAQTGSLEGFEVNWKKKNGETIIVRLSGRLVPGANGPEHELIAEDVTGQRALEDQLRQAQKMEAVGKLAGGIAHDFNNLLTVIKGHSELLHAEMRPSDAARKEVEGVIRAADRAVSLTRQLLAFSRRQLLTLKVLDLNSTVTSMERLLSRLLGENIQLTTVLEPSLPLIKADSHQIEQVIMNLAVNARDAMPTGGKLRISTGTLQLESEMRRGETLVKPGSYVMLSVIDTGYGMDQATLARAFEPFFTTKEQGQGTGLGLATVYGIVKQSEGEIWVESAPAQGTAFHVCFPAVMEKTKRAPAPKTVTEHQGEETILIVEDEDDVREVASMMLQRRGYRVLVARSSTEAEKICRTTKDAIHLLLTDVVLRETSGPEMAQALTALRPEMKVLYMSGYTDDVVLKHGIQNSQVDFLPKPFTRDELTGKVREVLGKVAAVATAHR